MNLSKILAGLSLFFSGAIFASVVMFVLSSERNIILILGILFGLAFAFSANLVIRRWVAFTRDGDNSDLESISEIIRKIAPDSFDEIKSKSLAIKITSIGQIVVSSWSMMAVMGVVFSVALYSATVLQVRRIDEQNKLIEVQNNLAEASRRSSLVFLFGNVMDRVSEELKAGSEDDRNLSEELIGRIAALAQAMRPYKFYEAGELTEYPISPERGQLITALYNSKLSEKAYFLIFNATDLRYADLREATLLKVNLSESRLDHADFSGANLISANLQLASVHAGIFENTILREADLTSTNFSDSWMLNADLRNVESFLAVRLEGAELSGVKMTADDWSKLLSEADSKSVNYLRENYKLGLNELTDPNGEFRLIEKL